jgi:hypothetical protein
MSQRRLVSSPLGTRLLLTAALVQLRRLCPPTRPAAPTRHISIERRRLAATGPNGETWRPVQYNQDGTQRGQLNDDAEKAQAIQAASDKTLKGMLSGFFNPPAPTDEAKEAASLTAPLGANVPLDPFDLAIASLVTNESHRVRNKELSLSILMKGSRSVSANGPTSRGRRRRPRSTRLSKRSLKTATPTKVWTKKPAIASSPKLTTTMAG